jgi:hypothetical protein
LGKNPKKKTVFVTVIASVHQERQARLLAESIRSFGEELGNSPIWMFSPAPAERLASSVFPLIVPDGLSRYIFGAKVHACAEAERMASADFGSVTYIDPSCLVVKPPLLFNLGGDADAAVRPVHIRNVGSPAEGPPDGYWAGIFQAVGVEDIPTTVESFVDGERIRSYFNTHAFAVDPRKGLMKKWLELFTDLVQDERFQKRHCRDERHRIFLFQAVLSALLASRVDGRRLRILPPDYNYPYNLHDEVPQALRPGTLDDVTCFTYEGRSLAPRDVTDIELGEPLKSWLRERINLIVPA